MSRQIFDNQKNIINFKEITDYPTLTVNYILGETDDTAILFRTLDIGEYVSDYKERIYRIRENEKAEKIPILFIESSDNITYLKTKAETYSHCIESIFKRKSETGRQDGSTN